MSTKWKLTSSEHVDELQDKAHMQAQGKHAQAIAGHARTKPAQASNYNRNAICGASA